MRRAWTLLTAIGGAGMSVAVVRAIEGKGWFSAGSGYDLLATLLLVASVIGGFCAAIALLIMRRDRTALVVGLLATAVGIWAIAITLDGTAASYLQLTVISFRPLLFWSVIAWPTGRLVASDRRMLILYSAILTACWAAWVLFEDRGLAVIDAAPLSAAFNDFGNNVVMPVGAIVVLVAVLRRFRRLPPTARGPRRLALAAGFAATVGDVVLVLVDRYLSELTSNESGRTALGGLVAVFDQGRFVAVPLLLAAGAWRVRSRSSTTRRTVELGWTAARLDETVAVALGDPTTVVAYHRPSGGWFTIDGSPVTLGRPGRHVTTIERAGVPVAAIDHDESFDDRPTTLEVAVAAAASAIEFEQIAALASARQQEVDETRRMIAEVERTTRRTLERDLHDGAQQRLVGLALHASLAERSRNGDAEVLVDGVEQALSDLSDLAAGVLPAILAEHGLAAALSTLAITAPMAVDVQVSLPAKLPTSIAGTAWFIIAEAVANATKHSEATEVCIKGGVINGVLRVSVIDNGVGGASVAGSGLRGLDQRSRTVGGSFHVTSPTGGGTSLTFEIPVPQ